MGLGRFGPRSTGLGVMASRLAFLGVLGFLGVVAVWGARVAQDAHLTAPAPTAFITDRDGHFITQAGHESVRADGTRQVEYGYWPVEPPARVMRATLALEDRRFWLHPGVDPLAVLRAVWQHIRGGHVSGRHQLLIQKCAQQNAAHLACAQHRNPQSRHYGSGTRNGNLKAFTHPQRLSDRDYF